MRTRYELEKAVASFSTNYLANVLGDLTGFTRHENRVKQCQEVLFEELNDDDPRDCAIAWFRRGLELSGVGGRGDFEGCSTERMPCFRKLGKGRKHASDGPAWTEALAQTHVPSRGSYQLILNIGRVQLTCHDMDGIKLFKPIPLFSIAPARWIRADARRALLRASCRKGLITYQEKGEVPVYQLPWGDDLMIIEAALHECDLCEQEEKWSALRDRAQQEYPDLYAAWHNAEHKSQEEKEAWKAILEMYPRQEWAWRPTWPDEN